MPVGTSRSNIVSVLTSLAMVAGLSFVATLGLAQTEGKVAKPGAAKPAAKTAAKPSAKSKAKAAPAKAGTKTSPAGAAAGKGKAAGAGAAVATSKPVAGGRTVAPDPKVSGGEPDGIVQVANLVYAGTKSSQCFADHFLVQAEKDSAISTSRRFHAVKLASDDVYDFPLVIMTGEGSFELSDAERQNLRRYVECGGFLVVSAGCSSEEWGQSFRGEMARVFPDYPLRPIGMEHPIFHTVYDISELRAKHGTPRPLEGISIGGRLGIAYSQDGLNDTEHTQGCCCCGGNELLNAVQINVNILAYALTY